MATQSGTDRGASYEPGSDAAKPAPEKASLFDDFIDIFYAPSTVFVRRASSGYGVHLLIISAVAAIFAFANRSASAAIFDAEFQRGVAQATAKNPRITPDMIEKMRPIQEGIANVLQYIGTPVSIFVVGLFVWVIGKLFSAKLTGTQAILIVTLAWIPRLVQAVLTTVQVLLMDTTKVAGMYSLSFSPARFMDPDQTQKQLLGIAGRFDIFTIWVTLLIGIGVAIVAKVPRSRAFGVAGGVWALAGLLTILLVR